MSYLQQMRTFADVVRIDLGRWPMYCLTSPAATNQILVTHARSFDKGHFFDRSRPLFGNGLPMSDGDFHRRQRRMIQPAFQPASIETYLPVIQRHALTRTGSWQPGQTIALDQEMNELCLEILVEALFAAKVGPDAVQEIYRSPPLLMRGSVTRTLTPSSWTPCPSRPTTGSTPPRERCAISSKTSSPIRMTTAPHPTTCCPCSPERATMSPVRA